LVRVVGEKWERGVWLGGGLGEWGGGRGCKGGGGGERCAFSKKNPRVEVKPTQPHLGDVPHP